MRKFLSVLRYSSSAGPLALTLFDRHLLGINPQTRMVVLSLRLSGEHYRALDGQPVADPAEEGQRPSQEVLDER